MNKYNEIMDDPGAYAWDIAEYANAQETLGKIVALYHSAKGHDYRVDEIFHVLWKITESYANHEQEKSNEQ